MPNAKSAFPTEQSKSQVGGMVPMSIDALGQAQGASSATPLPIGATARTVIDHVVVTAPAAVGGVGVLLSSLFPGGVLPVGAVAAEIQADGGIVRLKLNPGLVAPTTGSRLNDGVAKNVDSDLRVASIVGQTVAVPVSVILYDRI